MFRIGQSTDVHRLVDGRPLILGGIEIPHDKGLLGHSDADVLCHVIIEAIIGALGLGDIGKHFPDTDEKYKGACSIDLLKETVKMMKAQSYHIGNIDALVMAERPKLRPYIDAIINNLALVLEVAPSFINVKATTNEQMGYVGRQEGMLAQAVVLLMKDNVSKD